MTKAKSSKLKQILIVDDHPVVREALAARIGRQSGLKVCGEAANMAEALRLVAETKPDLAIVDISLKSGNGIDLIKRINDRNENVRMLVWSTHSEALYAERALRAGALGYVQKDLDADKIVEAIRRTLAGEIYLSDAMTEKLLCRAVGSERKEVARSPLDALANRELEIFRLIGEGSKSAEIAEWLHLSVHTVETYRERIRKKLDLTGSGELARYAMSWVLENG